MPDAALRPGRGRARLPAVDVEMQVGPRRREAPEEQRCGDRPGHTARGRVVEVRDARLDQGFVGCVERHPPDRVTHAGGGLRQGRCQRVAVGVEGRQVRADRHPGRPGQRGHRHDQVRRLLGGKGQRIGEDEATFGIRVVDLDRQPVACGQDVAGAEGVARHAVLDGRDQHPQPQVEAQTADHLGEAQHRGGPAHVLLHQRHRASGLQVQPPGVEDDALADQRDGRAGSAEAQVDQARGTVGGAPDGMDQRQVFRDQVVARGDAGLSAVPDRKRPCRRFQLGGTHVVGRGVDQLARQAFARGDAFDPSPVDAVGRHEARRRRSGRVLAAVVAIAREKPAERRFRPVVRVEAVVEAIGAPRHGRRDRTEGEAGAGPRLLGAARDDDAGDATILCGDHGVAAGRSLQPGGRQPGPLGRAQPLREERIIDPGDGKNGNGIGRRVGKARGLGVRVEHDVSGRRCRKPRSPACQGQGPTPAVPPARDSFGPSPSNAGQADAGRPPRRPYRRSWRSGNGGAKLGHGSGGIVSLRAE